MNLSDYEALSFDCYGTLIDWESGIGDVLVAWAADQSIDLDAERLLEVYATNEARVEAQTPTALYPEVLATAFRGVGEELGVPVSEDWAARLGRSVPDWPAFPDSREGLELLGRRYQLLILSNVDRAGFAASSERLGVTFDHVLTAEDVGSYKPANANFEALDRLRTDAGIPDGRLLHVAQSLFHDHVPAKQHGLSTVWINRRHDNPGWGATPQPDGDVQPDWTFPDLISFARAAV